MIREKKVTVGGLTAILSEDVRVLTIDLGVPDWDALRASAEYRSADLVLIAHGLGGLDVLKNINEEM